MPIYEYQCRKCGHQLEALQKISDKPLTDCPECKAPELRKMISAAAFRLKGSGWYETDFKSGGKKNLHGETDKPASGGTSGDSAGKPGKTDASTASAGDASSGSTGNQTTA